MKIVKPMLIAFIITLIACIQAGAQKNYTQEADNAYKLQQYYDAIDMYKKAYSKVKKNPVESNRIMFILADCYRKVNDFKNAEAQYRRLEKLEYYNTEPKVYLYLGDALKINEKYDEALIAYNNYNKLVPKDARGLAGSESCELVTKWLNKPTRYVLTDMKKFNSRDNEWSPDFADKKYRSLAFTSSREGSRGKGTDAWTGQSFSDLYITTSDKKDNWSTPVLFEEEGVINSDGNEGEASFSKNGNTIYFTRCPYENKKQSGCEIYTAKRKGRGWSEAEALRFTGTDTAYDYMHPSLSENELTIYFSSNMPGGHGGYDIWTATRVRKTKPFGMPVNLGPQINSKGNEAFPYLRYDTTLYFSSNALPGLGGYDIFKTVKTGDKWGDPVNLQVPMNSAGDDFGIIFFPLVEKGYLSSNRKGGRGGDDIWYFELPPLIFTLAGIVKNEKTLQLIPGALIKLVGSDGTSIEVKTDDKGAYKFDKTQILPSTTYNLAVSKKDFFSTSGTETTVGLEKNTDLIHNFMLTPIPKEPILLPEIRYNLARWELLPQYQDSLIGLIQTLQKNPTIVIELRSHTDVRPIPMTNDTLSQKRAQSVVEYLIQSGIEPGRLIAKGYAERVPRKLEKNLTLTYNNKTFTFFKDTVLTKEYISSLKSKDEQEAAHQLNRRTEFVILRDDFVPTGQNDSVSMGVSIVKNMNNVLQYNSGPGDIEIIPCIINGTGSTFAIDSLIDNINISSTEVKRLLDELRINKDDFIDKENAFNQDGSVIEKSKLRITSFKIGDKTLSSIEVTVINDLLTPMVMGRNFLIQNMGQYILDKNKKEIIFNK